MAGFSYDYETSLPENDGYSSIDSGAKYSGSNRLVWSMLGLFLHDEKNTYIGVGRTGEILEEARVLYNNNSSAVGS